MKELLTDPDKWSAVAADYDVAGRARSRILAHLEDSLRGVQTLDMPAFIGRGWGR